jgi:hypothetical protein
MFDYFGNLFCSPDEIKDLQSGKRAAEVLSTRKQNILSEVLAFANSGTGQRQAMKGNDFTMWSAYNAVTGYTTRKRFASADDRANSLLFGSAAELIHDAGTLALAPEKVQPLRKVKFDGLNLN